MKKYILFMVLGLLVATQNLYGYCVYNYTDSEILVSDSQKGHHRMGWHKVKSGESTCCAEASKGCHADKHIKEIHIKAKFEKSKDTVTCSIDATQPGNNNIYFFNDSQDTSEGTLICKNTNDCSNTCSNYCCSLQASNCPEGNACYICDGNCGTCVSGGHCGWSENQKK